MNIWVPICPTMNWAMWVMQKKYKIGYGFQVLYSVVEEIKLRW